MSGFVVTEQEIRSDPLPNHWHGPTRRLRTVRYVQLENNTTDIHLVNSSSPKFVTVNTISGERHGRVHVLMGWQKKKLGILS
jgi:hypothetical protein